MTAVKCFIVKGHGVDWNFVNANTEYFFPVCSDKHGYSKSAQTYASSAFLFHEYLIYSLSLSRNLGTNGATNTFIYPWTRQENQMKILTSFSVRPKARIVKLFYGRN
jgi:hypothetical protein